MTQTNLLSDEVIKEVVDRVDEAIDIPVVWGTWERSLIEFPVNQCNEQLPEVLGEVMSPEWARLVQVLLDASKASEDKTPEVQDIIGKQVREPLAAYVNEKIDIPMVPEDVEGKLFDTMLDQVIDAIVAQAVKAISSIPPGSYRPAAPVGDGEEEDQDEASEPATKKRRIDPGTSEQEGLLSDDALDVVVDAIDKAIDIPFVDGSWERSMIEAPMKQCNLLLKEAMGSFLGPEWGQCLSVLLDSSMASDKKTEFVQDTVGRKLRVPLGTALNSKIDIPVLPEGLEGKFFDTVVDKALDAMVVWSVKSLGQTVGC